jgi:hypothetical protein
VSISVCPSIVLWAKGNPALRHTEGLLVGGSSGSALAGAIKFLQTTPEGQAIAQQEDANVVVVLPDGIRNYISKVSFIIDASRSPGTDVTVALPGLVPLRVTQRTTDAAIPRDPRDSVQQHRASFQRTEQWKDQRKHQRSGTRRERYRARRSSQDTRG